MGIGHRGLWYGDGEVPGSCEGTASSVIPLCLWGWGVFRVSYGEEDGW